MKKKFIILSGVLMMAVGAFFTIESTTAQSNDLLMGNVEAVSSCEVTNKKGKVKFSCDGEKSHCEITYAGHTLTCTGVKN